MKYKCNNGYFVRRPLQKNRQILKRLLLYCFLLKQTYGNSIILLNNVMNQTHRLIFQSNLQVFFRSQCTKASQIKPLRDKIGPADPISNLCHVKYVVRENETPMERKLRNHREELQKWNEVFWTKHNLSFIQKKNKYIEDETKKKGLNNNEMLSAEEMSVFYKDFLDKNWKTHLKYLMEWYKKNVYVTYLHFLVNVEKICKKRWGS